MDINLKDNLINALTNKDTDITPVGSFPATCMTELMVKDGTSWPKGHRDAEQMAKIASSAYRYVGLESMVLPFDRLMLHYSYIFDFAWTRKYGATI
ncbi:MAG: uroporphyrinogen decarboxylase family protein [Methanosphaera sp.]